MASKEKKATQAKVAGKRQQSTRAWRVSVEIAESTDTKLLTVGTPPKHQGKGKGSGKSKSKVPEISESDRINWEE